MADTHLELAHTAILVIIIITKETWDNILMIHTFINKYMECDVSWSFLPGELIHLKW